MVTHHTLATAMCHHWEEVPIRELEPEAEATEDEPDDVTKEVAPA
ncbi:hypothetical protein [Halobacterium hubeiense]|nr:hypothetical protein [Halobacterium hubeiense]